MGGGQMAQIIPFPDVPKAERQTRTGGCHVLIFPGVRIERQESRDQKPAKRQAAKPRRKTTRPRRRTGT